MALYAFDGTWNVRDLKARVERVQSPQYGPDASSRRQTVETNVHRFHEFYGRHRSTYVQGVGTRFGWMGGLAGGAFGAGGKQRIREMYRTLCTNYLDRNDQNIDIIGFSRGAAMAVHFANVVAQLGIRNPNVPWHFPRADPLLGRSSRLLKGPAVCPRPTIRFLGLWDTVASFGLPLGPLRNRPSPNWIYQTIPANVRRSFHAMALDEVRATFSLVRPTRVDDEPGKPSRHYEVWFRGVHSNVGGGYPDRGLSDIALAWMMEMYLWTLDKEESEVDVPPTFLEALRQLQPEPKKLSDEWGRANLETLEPDPDGELGRPSDIRRQGWRQVPEGAVVHHAVHQRTANLATDHANANRRLRRPIAADVQAVPDPPFFYGRTVRQEAEAVALDAFHHIPVRASWLEVSGVPVVRSDDWVGLGQRRQDIVHAKTRETFVTVTTEWLLNGRPSVSSLKLPFLLNDYDGTLVAGSVAGQWVVDVLRVLEPYVPRLRAYGE